MASDRFNKMCDLYEFVKTYKNIKIILKVSSENKFQTGNQYQNTFQLPLP